MYVRRCSINILVHICMLDYSNVCSFCNVYSTPQFYSSVLSCVSHSLDSTLAELIYQTVELRSE